MDGLAPQPPAGYFFLAAVFFAAVIEHRAADLLNVKLAKCGSLGLARELLDRARAAGMGTIVGSMMEGPIGVGAAAALVAAVRTTHVSDLDAAWWASSSPVVGGASYDAGVIVLPAAPGLGIEALRGSQARTSGTRLR